MYRSSSEFINLVFTLFAEKPMDDAALGDSGHHVGDWNFGLHHLYGCCVLPKQLDILWLHVASFWPYICR